MKKRYLVNKIFNLIIVTFITFQSSLADQLTISFDNVLPDICNDVWFENGIEMELIKIDNSQNFNWFCFSELKIISFKDLCGFKFDIVVDYINWISSIYGIVLDFILLIT